MAKDKSEKITMGRNSNGVIHPGKGMPSGANKEEELGLQPGPPEQLEEYLAITDKYTDGEDVMAENVPIRHRNRNTTKGQDNFKGKDSNTNKTDNQNSTDEKTNTVAEQLPGILTKERFTELADYKADCTISLFIPTHAQGVEVNEQFDKISFKSLLNTVEQQLKEKRHNPSTIERLLKPVYELIGDNDFWTKPSEGLAVFISDGFFKYIKMPLAPEKQIVIESTFYVTPLIPLMTSADYFYLLVMSKQTVKLFKVDMFGIQPVPVDVPQGIEEVKRLSDLDAATYRSGDSGKRATPAAMAGQAHGGGGGNPDAKDNLATYFEAVDDILWEKVFNRENVPLLLAGVEYEIPIYKSVCDYHNVWNEALTGSREHQTMPVLYQDAKKLMQPFFEQRQNKALEKFGNKSATELTSSIVSDVIPAAFYGRIAQLFVCKGCQVWGLFDEMTNEIQLHEAQLENSEDLLDHAVVKTLATGGEVFLLEKDKMPAASFAAAIMRY